MAFNKLSGFVLLIIAITLVGVKTANYVKAEGEPMCLQYCRSDLEYMTCGTSDEKLSPGCINCCMAPKDCTLHYGDGTSEFCGN